MAGLRGAVSQSSETHLNVPDIAVLAHKYRQSARFTKVMTQLMKRKRILHSPEYKSQERRPRGQATTVNHPSSSNYSSTDETFEFVDASFLTPGDLVAWPSQADMGRVRQVNSATQVVITRGVGTTAQTIPHGAEVQRLVRVEAEGYTIGSAFTTETTHVVNYIASQSTPAEWTDYQVKQASYIGGESQKQSRVKDDERQAAQDHMRDTNKMLLFSKKSKTTVNNRTLYTTHGLIPSIVSNIYNHSGGQAMTATQLVRSVIGPSWRDCDSTEKWAFVAGKIGEDLGLLGYDKFREVKGNRGKEMGFEVTSWRMPYGVLNFVHEPCFDTSTFYSESMVIADFEFLELAIWEDLDYQKDLQNKKDHMVLNEWTTKVGLDITYEEVHGFSYDLRTGT